MSDLYLNPGESLILTTNRISINFIPFELMLTSLRLIILDNVSNRFSPQVIPLGDIFSVNGATISTGEPIIRITLTDHDGDGSLIPIDFVFSQSSTRKRKQERDEWLRTLMEKLVAVRQEKVLNGIQSPGPEEEDRFPLRRWMAPEILHPMPLVTGPDLPVAETETPTTPELPVVPGEPGNSDLSSTGDDNSAPPGGKVGKSNEPESPPGPALDAPSDEMKPEEPGYSTGDRPVPVKMTRSLDVPSPRSHMTETPLVNIPPFQVAMHGDEDTGPGSSADVSSPSGISEGSTAVVEEPKEISGAGVIADQSGFEGKWEQTAPESHPAPVVVNWPVIRIEPTNQAPAFALPDRTNSQDIRSQLTEEPEKSEPKTDSAPEIPAIRSEGDEPVREKPDGKTEHKEIPDKGTVAEVLEKEPAPVDTGSSTGEAIVGSLSPESAPAPVAAAERASHTRPNPAIAIIAIIGIILVSTVAGFLYFHSPPDNARSQIPAITHAVTPNATPAVKTITIPNVGVWIHVTYPGDYYGRVGNPGDLQEIAGTGSTFYFIRSSGNLVQANIQKRDNSGDTLTVELFNNGTLVFNSSVRTPMGTASFLVDPVTGKVPESHPE